MLRISSALPRILLAGLLAVISAVAVLAASPSRADAASCYGDWCSGQDPMSTGCYSDAYTTTSYDFGTATLEVSWSPSCQTNWARLVASGGGCLVGGTLSAVQDTGYTQSTSVGNTCWSNDVFWTAMIYSPVHQVRARHADWQGNTYLTAWS